MPHSKRKGKNGELEVVQLLKEFNFDARRGQQFKGTPDSPDVVHDMKGIHIEVKRTEALRLWEAIDQANEDCGDDIPVVFHRPNGKPWIAILAAEDFLELMKELYDDDSEVDTHS